MRSRSRILAISLAGLLACLDQTVAPPDGERLNVQVAGTISVGLDSFRITVNGPTTRTVSGAPGATVTINGLAVGSYTVILQGYKGDGVAYFGQTAGVNVVKGQTATATVTVASNQTAILSIPSYTNGQPFSLVYSKVNGATGYVVQRATSAAFTGSLDTTVAATDTSILLSIPATGPYYVRVLALDPTSARGQPSAAATVTTVTTITVSPPTVSIAAGATQQFTATAKDAQNNTVAGVTFYWASQDGSVATVDPLSGLATGKAGGSTKITALGIGIPGTATLTVGAITPTKLAFTIQPTSATAGTAFNPAIQLEIRDASDNLVSGARNAVTLAIGTNPGSTTLIGTTTVNAVGGIASFSGLSIQKTGTGYTLTASASGLTGSASTAFNITPASAAKLAFSVQPGDREGNVAFSPNVAVEVRDAFDNVVTSGPGSTSSITIAMGTNPWAGPNTLGGSLFGTTTQAASAGVATFGNLRVDKPAAGYTIVAAASGLTSATSTSFAISLTLQSIVPAPTGSHTCGVAAGGAYCWGYNGQGQLGGPTGAALPNNTDPVAVLVRGGITFTQVSAGGSHSCGLTSGGQVYCWGYNAQGQLGNLNGAGGLPGNNSTTPILVTGLSNVTQVSAGANHTCARTSGNAVYCWGYNYYGQLGGGGALPGTNTATPTLVVGGLSFASVAAGAVHTCARTTASPSATYCWGYNYDGELGNLNGALGLPGNNSSSPILVGGGINWASISVGQYHSCGVSASNVAYCWGYNGNGRLGDNTLTSNYSPVAVSGGTGIAVISAGGSHSCAATTGKVGICWGYNGQGQLGDGTTTESHIPVQVSGSLAFDAIATGSNHSCGRVGSLGYCWGAGNSGQLGTGALANTSAPAQIVQ